MNKVEACYFCVTPYQMITSILMCKSKKETADLYIVPQFEHADEYAENLEKLGIFNTVRYVDTSALEKHKEHKNRFLMHLGIARQYFRVDQVAESVLLPDTVYEKMYVSSKAYIGRMVYFYIKKHEIDTELIYFDDGEGSYYNRNLTEAGTLDKMMRYLAFGKKARKGAHTLYLYDPDLFRSLNGDTWDGEICSIPHDMMDGSTQKELSSVFGISADDLISEPVIIMDVIKEGKYRSADKARLFESYDFARDTFSPENVIVKKHPRDHSREMDAYKCYERYNIPFECLCTQMDMNKKVLIAVSSTSVVIPNILLGQEPVVILLYKIVRQYNLDEESIKKQNEFYMKCRERYSDREKFCVPESMEELKEMITKIRDRYL